MTKKFKNGGGRCNTEVEPTIWKWKPTGPPPPWAHALFLTELGSRIEFLVVDDQLSKERIEALLITYGGIVCESMSIVSTNAVILVEDNFCPPSSWGPCFSRRFVRDCIESFTLLELEDYVMDDDYPVSRTSESMSKALYLNRQQFRPEPLPITFFLPNFIASQIPPLRKLSHNKGQKSIVTIMYGCVCKCHFGSTKCGSCKDHCKKDTLKKIEEDINSTNAIVSSSQDLVGSVADNMSPASQSETLNSQNQLKNTLVVAFDKVNHSQTNNDGNTTDLKSQNKIIKAKKKRLLKVSDLYNFSTPEEDRTLPGSSRHDASSFIQQTPTCSKIEEKEKSSLTKKKDIPSKNTESTKGKKEKETSLTSNIEVSSTNCVAKKTTNASDQSDSDDSIPDLEMWPDLKKYSDTKHTRKPYSRKEQESILKYIIAKKAYTRLKSDAFYKEMEARKICPNRTYQSLKNHFLKTILLKLDTFEFLSDKIKRYLRGEI